MALRLPPLGPRTRKILRYVGFVVLALVTFVFALQMTFPFHRIEDKLKEALGDKYVVDVQEIEPGIIPGRVYFHNVRLITRQTKPDDPVTTYSIKKLELDVGLLPLLGGNASIDIDGEIGQGTLTGNVTLSSKRVSIDVQGDGLPATNLPIRDVIGLPMSGKLQLRLALAFPLEKQKGKTAPNWAKSQGNVLLACRSGCTFGDGKTKLKTKLKSARNQAFAADGIEFGKVNVNTLVAKVDIKRGKLKVTEWDTKSDDGQLYVDYEMDLAPKWGDSDVNGCLRFVGSPALLDREPKTYSAISATGAPMNEKDNLYHITLSGKFSAMRKLGKFCGPDVGASDADGDAKPNLTIQPDPAKSATPPTNEAAATPATPTFAPPTDAGAGSAAATPDAAIPVPVPGPEGETDAPAEGGSAAELPTPNVEGQIRNAPEQTVR